MYRPVAIATAIAVLAVVPAEAAEAANERYLKRQVAYVKGQNAKLRRSRAAVITQREQFRTQAAVVPDLRSRVTSLEQQNAALATANNDLKGSLPAQVGAVAREGDIGELFRLVINPAHGSWACGGTRFFGETFWSTDFDRRASDGTCY